MYKKFLFGSIIVVLLTAGCSMQQGTQSKEKENIPDGKVKASESTNVINAPQDSQRFAFLGNEFKIDLKGLTLKEYGQDEYLIFSGSEIAGGIFGSGYQASEPNSGLPNHSETLSSETLQNKTIKGKMFVVRRSESAAAGKERSWKEIYAVIPHPQDKGLAYVLWLKLSNPRKSEQEQLADLKKIISSIELLGTQKKIKKDYFYENKSSGYSLVIPKGWEEKYVIDQRDDESIFIFRSNSSPEVYGELFRITVVPREKWNRNGGKPGTGIEIGENKGRVYTLLTPSDNPFKGAEQQEYGIMVQEVKEIIKSFRILN